MDVERKWEWNVSEALSSPLLLASLLFLSLLLLSLPCPLRSFVARTHLILHRPPNQLTQKLLHLPHIPQHVLIALPDARLERHMRDEALAHRGRALAVREGRWARLLRGGGGGGGRAGGGGQALEGCGRGGEVRGWLPCCGRRRGRAHRQGRPGVLLCVLLPISLLSLPLLLALNQRDMHLPSPPPARPVPLLERDHTPRLQPQADD